MPRAHLRHFFSIASRRHATTTAKPYSMDLGLETGRESAAAGRGDSATQISMEGIAKVMEDAMERVRALLDHVVPLI